MFWRSALMSVVAVFFVFTSMAWAVPVTLDLAYTVDGKVGTSSVSWGTISFEQSGDGIEFEVKFKESTWKVISVVFNYDDAKFSNSSVFKASKFDVKTKENYTIGSGGLKTFDLELKKGANYYGSVKDILYLDGGVLMLDDIYPWAEGSQGLLAGVHIGAISGTFNDKYYGTDGSQMVGAKDIVTPPTPPAVPEPSTLLLLGGGLVGLAYWRRRQN